MKIVIAGGGKVGSVLCTELSTEEHDIILIEKNETILDSLINKNDISGIVGNGASYDIQQEAGVDTCDLFIAVTPQDELNMIACILAKKLGARYTIARVRNPEYSSHFEYVRERLGVNMMINPEFESARSISRIIKFPTVLSVQSFANNQVELIEVEVHESSVLANLSLNDFRRQYGNVLVCAIQRGEELIIPSGSDELRDGDNVYVMGDKQVIRKFYKTVRPHKNNINSVLIIGGGRITYYLIGLLKEYRMDIKVIEQNQEIAEQLSAAYPEIEVILGDGTDQEILQQEGIDNYHAFVSLTGVDEENIIASLYAAQQDVNKVITKVNRELLLRIFDTLGMESIITPKRVIANSILRFVRSLGNPYVSDVEALYRIADNAAEAIQFKVKATSKVKNIPLEKLRTKSGILIAYIIRDHQLLIPSGQDEIKENDHVIVITKEKKFDDIDDILK
ncbi:Trk system potassium transporter TrkA [Jeotgalibaca ciconiae]|uniref:Trk system potassium uptake protein TrkA n=1 Tax=Jeotgalibaca ciconiae TaxID=2496265 RepID=A0A3S9H9M8_9LACT|nr:Trk system potassium transporter TrkA [Jeotgalibaca ciconiae]AZP04058.1 Trk system potassium transporter TrkA [Jeotgalibaca ciconiae]